MSHIDKACLGDLFNSKCVIGEAKELVEASRKFLGKTLKIRAIKKR